MYIVETVVYVHPVLCLYLLYCIHLQSSSSSYYSIVYYTQASDTPFQRAQRCAVYMAEERAKTEQVSLFL